MKKIPPRKRTRTREATDLRVLVDYYAERLRDADGKRVAVDHGDINPVSKLIARLGKHEELRDKLLGFEPAKKTKKYDKRIVRSKPKFANDGRSNCSLCGKLHLTYDCPQASDFLDLEDPANKDWTRWIENKHWMTMPLTLEYAHYPNAGINPLLLYIGRVHGYDFVLRKAKRKEIRKLRNNNVTPPYIETWKLRNSDQLCIAIKDYSIVELIYQSDWPMDMKCKAMEDHFVFGDDSLIALLELTLS